MAIEEKIANGDTEIQRCFALYQKNYNEATSRIQELKEEIRYNRSKRKESIIMMRECIERAKEQGYDESIFEVVE